jgi:hypothetical protein
MEERIFFVADVDKHRFEPVLDVFHPAFENAADDVAVARPLDRILFKDAVFEQGDPLLEFLGINDQFVPGLARSHSKDAFDAFGHGNEFGSKLLQHWGRKF